jgi:hypothetical protein
MPLLFPVWFAASSFAFRSLFRTLRFRFVHAGEELFFSCAAGLGWISLCALLLGTFGLAGAGAFAAAAALSLCAGFGLRFAPGEPTVPPPVPSPREYAVLLAAALPFPLVFIPPFFYDTLHYHYGLPSLFLASGSTRPLPHFVESHFPLGVEMLNMVGMADGGYLGANLVAWLSYLLCALGILALADRLGDRRAGLAAAPLFLFSSTALHAVFLQKNDPGTTLFFFAFLYSCIPAVEAGDHARKFRFLAGGLCGAALGTKYTMLASCAAAAPACLLLAARRREGLPPGRPLSEFLPFTAAAAAVWTPWLLRNAAATGNPVYPLLNAVFRAPSWSPERMKMLSGDAHPFSEMFHGPADLWNLAASLSFFPDSVLSGPGASLGAAFPLFLLSLFLLPRNASPEWRFLRFASASLLAAWFFTSWFSRFLLPALPAMALLSGHLLSEWTRNRQAPRTALAGAVLLCVCLQLAAAEGFSKRMGMFNAWRTSLLLPGRPDRAALLAGRFFPAYGAARFVNSSLPATSRILFVGETRPFYFERDVVAPSPFDEHPLQKIAPAGRDPVDVSRALSGAGFTHILFNEFEWHHFGKSYYARTWDGAGRGAVERWLASLPEIYREKSVRVLAIPAGDGEAR